MNQVVLSEVCSYLQRKFLLNRCFSASRLHFSSKRKTTIMECVIYKIYLYYVCSCSCSCSTSIHSLSGFCSLINEVSTSDIFAQHYRVTRNFVRHSPSERLCLLTFFLFTRCLCVCVQFFHAYYNICYRLCINEYHKDQCYL